MRINCVFPSSFNGLRKYIHYSYSATLIFLFRHICYLGFLSIGILHEFVMKIGLEHDLGLLLRGYTIDLMAVNMGSVIGGQSMFCRPCLDLQTPIKGVTPPPTAGTLVQGTDQQWPQCACRDARYVHKRLLLT